MPGTLRSPSAGGHGAAFGPEPLQQHWRSLKQAHSWRGRLPTQGNIMERHHGSAFKPPEGFARGTEGISAAVYYQHRCQ